MAEPTDGPATAHPDAHDTPATTHLVLASASPRRAELLGRLGLSPEIRPASVDETPHLRESAVDLARRLASAKADHAAAQGHGGDEVVLAADTVVVLDDQPLGKPLDRADAAAMLIALAGRTHEVVTGLAVCRNGQAHRTHVSTAVTFRELSPVEIDWYLATGEPYDKAGGYGLQGAGAALVERLHGSDTNVIGLPLAETVALLRQVGLDVLRPPQEP